MSTSEVNLRNPISITTDPRFKPVLIDDLETKVLKEDERGKMYILRNPKNSKYVKMHESVLNILKCFDGKNSIEDISQTMKAAKVPLDAHEFVTLLAEEGFIKNINPPEKKERGGIFSFEIKLFTLTGRHMGFLKKVFFFVRCEIFRIFYAIFLAVGFSLFIYNFSSIFLTVVGLMSPEGSLFPLFISMAIFYLVEFAHEFAHAVSHYHYGGKSSEIGIEFHFFIPFFYTSTSDATWMETRKQIVIFIAGPMTSLFFAESFTLFFIFEPTLRYIWAAQSLFWHISALITLNPIIKTDGYFIVQALTKFPNLLEHGSDALVKAFRVLIGKISLEEFKEHLSQYSAYEKKVLKIYVPLFPIATTILVFLTVFMGLQFGIIKVLNMTPQILAGTAQGVKPYVIWIFYVFSISFSFIGIIGTLMNVIRGRVSDKQDKVIPHGET